MSWLKGIPVLLIIITGLSLPATKCFSQTKPTGLVHSVNGAQKPMSPQVLMPAPGYTPVMAPDGTSEHYFTEGEFGRQAVMRIRSSDEGRTWGKPEFVLSLPPDEKWYSGAPHVMFDKKAQLHLFHLDLKAKEMGFWHARSSPGSRQWSKWQYIGTSGPQNNPIQLGSGRIVVPVGYWVPDQSWDTRTGKTESTTYYSDDEGVSWQRSAARLTVPNLTDYPGVHEGGYEPVILELKDGRVWMLIRTQAGYLYESFSQDGANWSEPKATQFSSSDSPASLVRLPQGEIVMFWNNCIAPASEDGAFIYTGRDALHAALSRDEGKTWFGYREIYLDPSRNEPPPKTGDRGTSYPAAALTKDGNILLVSGQGEDRRRFILVDPDWLNETHHEDNFSGGMANWSVFKSFGPAKSFQRNRTAGAESISHPNKQGARVLHVRRPDEKAGDGAVWNFPIGHIGKVSIRILLREGFQGGLVALTDRFFNPELIDMSHTTFALSIGGDGRLSNGTVLEKERWYNIDLKWQVEQSPPGDRWPGTCRISVNGQEVLTLPQLNRAQAGVGYLRLNSTAGKVDRAGFLIESVTGDIERKGITSSSGQGK